MLAEAEVYERVERILALLRLTVFRGRFDRRVVRAYLGGTAPVTAA